MALFFVSDCCPVGCGQVVVLQSSDDRRLFCYCDACGCVFRSPAEAQFEAGLNEIVEPVYFAPNGVVCPSRETLEQAGWGNAIIEVCENDNDIIVKVNAGIAERRRSGDEPSR